MLDDILGQPSVEIRDAAVQAAESWGDRQVVDVLQNHEYPEPRLTDYVANVIRDLSS